MAAQRRTPSRGAAAPRARSGPGRTGAARSTLRSGLGAAAAAAQAAADRPRFTGRAVILLLVLFVLAISWASSFRAWMQQRDQINALRDQIEQTHTTIDDLKGEKRRWHDDAYLQQQARLRFGFQMPGEQAFQALDENGKPIDSVDTLPSAPVDAEEEEPTWVDIAWGSIEAAGNPEESK